MATEARINIRIEYVDPIPGHKRGEHADVTPETLYTIADCQLCVKAHGGKEE